MSDAKKRNQLWLLLAIVIIVSVVITIRTITKSTDVVSIETQYAQKQLEAESTDNSSMSLEDIIKTRTTWDPSYASWYGKTAPDFTLTGLDGKPHTLSGYRGKNVLLVFWATWCGPCIMELPHLKALRTRLSKDKLAILAISNEPADLLKKFASDKKINYTILLTDTGGLPSPFGSVNSIPCSFFVTPEGKIKFATVGPLTLGIMKAIILAEK